MNTIGLKITCHYQMNMKKGRPFPWLNGENDLPL